MVNIKQYSIWLVNLDPTIGSEIKKVRPAVVISPNEMNDVLNTVIIAPMTTKIRDWPTRVLINFQGRKGEIALDQIRTIDKRRLIKELGYLDNSTILKVKLVLKEMLID
ncbi:type II toxin-antitoxin system PemK/MazF family toxin [Persephonella sp. KM09-Lau-8]|uniref:type II toxin-antitoxin system PemK/MazF family toxin n=1 Tax=Persephonella sp. KM09-Lau-8 TaxID=1158345 RepID=UPI000497045F|nr:type II toxin-antitoxin system PemK/MazF family toxin [Persephonella sp. KM09-Lau-8]